MKTKINRLVSFTTALVLALSALAVWTPQRALAATRTWDGEGDDTNWSTAENWSDDTVPVDGDIITFDLTVPSETEEEIFNDLEDLSLAGITLTGAGDSNKSFLISGNGLTLAGPITENQESGYIIFGVDVTLGANFTISGDTSLGYYFGNPDGLDTTLDLGEYSLTVNHTGGECKNIAFIRSSLKGSGDITVTAGKLNLMTAADGYTGDVTVNGGGLSVAAGALGSENAVTVNGTAELRLVAKTAATFAMPITMNSSADPALVTKFNPYMCVGSPDPDKTTTTLTGSLTLSRDTIFSGDNDLKVTGTFTANDHTLSTKSGSLGSITTSEGTVEPKAVKVTIEADDKQPNKSETLGNKHTYIIDGERGAITVNNGGVLMGTGKVSHIYAYKGAKLAPGHSPGSMTVLKSMNLSEGAEFEAEILNKDEYDKFVVGEDFDGTGNAVVLNSATLALWIPEGFKISKDDTFTIIDNRSDTDVNGTFKDLPEGATFKAGGESDGVFKITYEGGDGNDVVLSVVTVPTVPSTGFFLGLSNPAVVLIAALATAGAAFYLTRRYAFATAKK